jgi:putative NADH-flavin reductase
MNIVVIGASRGVGSRVVERALVEGHRVTAAVRNLAGMQAQHERLRIVACDVRDPVAVSAAVRGQDAVVCAVGAENNDSITLYSTAAENILRGMREHGVRRLVFLSNFGVLDETATDWRGSILLFLVRRVIKHTLADHRRALEKLRRSELQWTAVRPMALTNGPAIGRYRIALDALPAKGWRIARADVAEFMLRQAQDDRYLHEVPALAY